MSLLDVIKKVDASANKAGACLIGQYLVDKSNEGEQSLHKTGRKSGCNLRVPTIEEVALIGHVNISNGSSANETAFVSVNVDLPVKKEEKLDSDGNEVAKVNKKRKAEKIFEEYEHLVASLVSKDPESEAHLNSTRSKYEKTKTALRSLRRKLSTYTSPSKRGATISDRESLGVGHYEIERKDMQEKIKELEDTVENFEKKIRRVEPRVEALLEKHKLRLKRHRLYIEKTSRKLELDETLEQVQQRLDDISEKLKDAQAVTVSFEMPQEFQDQNFGDGVSAKNVQEMSKVECLKEIERVRSICKSHKRELLRDGDQKKKILANDPECKDLLQKMEDVESEIANIGKNLKLACDKYDELRSQALNVIFDENNTNQIVLALRILHQNGGAMMMDDFKQQIQSRINCADGSSKDTKDSSAPVDPVQLVYTLLANRLVQFDRSNGTEVFSFLL